MEIKKLWKYFVVIFLLFFLIINWSRISWIFNFQMVSGFFSDLFQKDEKEEILVESKQPILQTTENSNQIDRELDYSEKEDSLEIPKIGVSVPIVFDKSLDDNGVFKAMDRGVVWYPSSVLPNENGQTIILGHSAPPQWPKVKFYHIFVRLNELTNGDTIYLYFNHKKYEYIVTRKLFLEKGEEIPQPDLTKNANMLYLVSCWPPETGKRRIAIEAQLEN